MNGSPRARYTMKKPHFSKYRGVVRPKVAKVMLLSVGECVRAMPSKKIMAHGVRNLVQDLDLLSPIGK